MRVRLLASTVAALGLVLMPLSIPASADGPSTGGAMHDPNAPPLSGAEMQILGQKRAKFEQARAAAESRKPGQVTSFASGIAFADIFEEPQNQPGSQNWCGPGSTTAVITNWNNTPYNYNGTYGTGAVAYMTWLAKTGVSGIGPMVVTAGNGKPITYDYTLRATVNNQIGQTYYYVIVGVNGSANFSYYLVSDIVYDVHPLFTVVWTPGLYGWGTYGVAHYQWINSVCDTCNYIQYGDSAGPNASPNGTPFGYHTDRTLTDYYNLNVHNVNVWDEIIW